jgi:hypothetical protein
MTRTQRSAHARVFALLTPLLAILIALALLRSHRTSERLHAPPPSQGVVP